MIATRRSFLSGFGLSLIAAPAVIRQPGLLMPIRDRAAHNPSVAIGSICGNTLIVPAVLSGQIREGMSISGTGIEPGTMIMYRISGCGGGPGAFLTSGSQTVMSTTMLAS